MNGRKATHQTDRRGLKVRGVCCVASGITARFSIVEQRHHASFPQPVDARLTYSADWFAVPNQPQRTTSPDSQQGRKYLRKETKCGIWESSVWDFCSWRRRQQRSRCPGRGDRSRAFSSKLRPGMATGAAFATAAAIRHAPAYSNVGPRRQLTRNAGRRVGAATLPPSMAGKPRPSTSVSASDSCRAKRLG